MKRKGFWIGTLAGSASAVVLGMAIVPVSGVVPMSADSGMGPMDVWGEVALETSLFWRAPSASVPENADLKEGERRYGSTCFLCHAAPGLEPVEWADDMLPEPPALWTGEPAERSDGKFFYVIKHGIRMTGMPAFAPTHTDEQIWDIVAYVRTLKE